MIFKRNEFMSHMKNKLNLCTNFTRIKFKEVQEKIIKSREKNISDLTLEQEALRSRFPFLVLASNESIEMDLPWLVNNIITHNRVCSNRSIGLHK